MAKVSVNLNLQVQLPKDRVPQVIRGKLQAVLPPTQNPLGNRKPKLISLPCRYWQSRAGVGSPKHLFMKTALGYCGGEVGGEHPSKDAGQSCKNPAGGGTQKSQINTVQIQLCWETI